ncbi:MAG: hypothetical protein HYY93_03460 [Planctomycetes bacterium]|nr:hypothetical protein [Planctomycetota bacterium]
MSEIRFCPGCGAPWTPGTRFCSRCGVAAGAVAASVPASPPPALAMPAAPMPYPSPAAPPALPATAPADVLAWQIDVSVLGNRLMRGSLVKGCLLTAALSATLLGAIFGFSSGEPVVALQAAGLAVAAVFVLFGLGFGGYLLLIGFYQPIAYRLDEDGVTMLNASRVAKGIHRTAVIAGLLGGNLAVAAAGASAERSETRSCSWKEARTVEDHPSDLTLVVRGGLLDTVQVFCTTENYAQVRNFILARTPHAARR